MNLALSLRFLLHGTFLGGSCVLALLTSQSASAQTAQAPPATIVDAGAAQANSGGMTLTELLVYAAKHAPTLATADAQVALARAEVTTAAPWFPQNPELSGSLGSRTSAGATGLQYEVSLAQKLEVSGERGLRRRAAEAEQKVAGSRNEALAWRLHVEIHRLHNELLLMAERRSQAERFVAFSESLQKIASGQVEAGETSALTLLVADADLAQTRSVLLEVIQQESLTRIALAGLVGWPRSKALSVEGELPSRGRAPATETLLRLMAQHHPSLLVRREAVAARQARLEAERRSAFPDPTVGASYTREPGVGGQASTDIWLFNLSVPLPLWQRNQGGVARAAAELDLARGEAAQVENSLENHIQLAATALNSASERVEIYEKSVIPQLQKNLNALQKAYELGEVNLLQVSQTRERLLEGSKQYLDARVSYFGAVAQLEGLIGTELSRVSMPGTDQSELKGRGPKGEEK
jgi:cobalt-zinc-cadmium efflux system outer membrane protein